MKKTIRTLVATLGTAAASTALAAGDSGTSSMGEMQLNGGHFLMILGGMAALGGVVWVVAKFAGK